MGCGNSKAYLTSAGELAPPSADELAESIHLTDRAVRKLSEQPEASFRIFIQGFG